MPRFAANLHYLFTEHRFLERFQKAARAGFLAVEFLVPYDYPCQVLGQPMRTHKMERVTARRFTTIRAIVAEKRERPAAK